MKEGNVDGQGQQTLAKQPAFGATFSTDQVNILPGTSVATFFDVATYDTTGDYDTVNYRYEVPVTGFYQINMTVLLANVDTAANYYAIYVGTSLGFPLAASIDPTKYSADVSWLPVCLSGVLYAAVGETIRGTYLQNGGAAQTDILKDGNAGGFGSYFSGILIA